jgi:uncharacterized membrane protein YdjX (TVP38/TMEM64 family)
LKSRISLFLFVLVGGQIVVAAMPAEHRQLLRDWVRQTESPFPFERIP